jgi:hypothetical protein
LSRRCCGELRVCVCAACVCVYVCVCVCAACVCVLCVCVCVRARLLRVCEPGGDARKGCQGLRTPTTSRRHVLEGLVRGLHAAPPPRAHACAPRQHAAGAAHRGH